MIFSTLLFYWLFRGVNRDAGPTLLQASVFAELRRQFLIPVPDLAPQRAPKHGSAAASSDGAPGRVVVLPIVLGTLTLAQTAGVPMNVSPHARPAAKENGHGVDSVSSEVPLCRLFVLGVEVEGFYIQPRESWRRYVNA